MKSKYFPTFLKDHDYNCALRFLKLISHFYVHNTSGMKDFQVKKAPFLRVHILII